MNNPYLEKLKNLARATRDDGWVNALTGLGTYARDKVMSSAFMRNRVLSDEELDAMFEDDMGSRIVEKVVDDSLRKGVEVKIAIDEERYEEAQSLAHDIIGYLDDLGAVPKLAEADIWGRLYGGGAVLINADDSGAAHEELVPETIRSIRSLLVIDKRDITPHTLDADRDSRSFGEPLVYKVTTNQIAGDYSAPQVVHLIHASRLIVFEGRRTSRRKRKENNGWSLSVLQPVNDVLRQWSTSWQAAAHLMTDGSQGIWKMKGLVDMISAGQDQIVKDRMRIADMGRSVVRSVLIDSEEEEFTRNEVNMGGYATMLDKFMVRLAAAADMPVTVLLGQSPAGLNSTGESDRSLWDERVQAHQTIVLKPRIERLLYLVMCAKDSPTKGKVPENWSVIFPPLRQMTEHEIADLRGKVAAADAVYITNQVVTPEEIAESRFGRMGWSMNTNVDLNIRRAMAEMDKKTALESVGNGKNATTVPTIAPVEETATKLELTATAVGAITKVNEARAQLGLSPIPDSEGGNLTILEFQAKNAATVAAAANAEAGDPSASKADDKPAGR